MVLAPLKFIILIYQGYMQDFKASAEKKKKYWKNNRILYNVLRLDEIKGR
jgi:hypothetical protein